MSEVLFCLCVNCGTITLERSWTYWQGEDDADGNGTHWRPSEHGEGDPMCKCPECGWEHVDDDSGPGLYLGSLQEMHAERVSLRDDLLTTGCPSLVVHHPKAADERPDDS